MGPLTRNYSQHALSLVLMRNSLPGVHRVNVTSVDNLLNLLLKKSTRQYDPPCFCCSDFRLKLQIQRILSKDKHTKPKSHLEQPSHPPWPVCR